MLDAERDWTHLLVLGDLVGYGAAPNEVIDRIRELDPVAVIRGNHDKAACGIEDGSNFNQVARVAALWTYETLTDDNRQYLRELPAGPEAIDDHVEICHGSPFDEDHYIFDGEDALRALGASARPLCLFGHTHLPVVFHYENEMFDGFVPEPDDADDDLHSSRAHGISSTPARWVSRAMAIRARRMGSTTPRHSP